MYSSTGLVSRRITKEPLPAEAGFPVNRGHLRVFRRVTKKDITLVSTKKVQKPK